MNAPRRAPSVAAHALRLAVIALTLCAATACEKGTTETGFRTIAAEGWDEAECLSFDIDSIGATGRYALEIGLRNTVTPPYPFREIAIAVGRHGDGLSRTDTLFLPVRPPYGEMQVRGVSLLQYDFPIDTMHLEAGTRLRITLQHLMSRSPLPGIKNVGIRLKKI